MSARCKCGALLGGNGCAHCRALEEGRWTCVECGTEHPADHAARFLVRDGATVMSCISCGAKPKLCERCHMATCAPWCWAMAQHEMEQHTPPPTVPVSRELVDALLGVLRETTQAVRALYLVRGDFEHAAALEPLVVRCEELRRQLEVAK